MSLPIDAMAAQVESARKVAVALEQETAWLVELLAAARAERDALRLAGLVVPALVEIDDDVSGEVPETVTIAIPGPVRDIVATLSAARAVADGMAGELGALFAATQIVTDEHGVHRDGQGRVYRLVDVGAEISYVLIDADADGLVDE